MAAKTTLEVSLEDYPSNNRIRLLIRLDSYGIKLKSSNTPEELRHMFIHISPFIQFWINQPTQGDALTEFPTLGNLLYAHLINRITTAYNLGYVSDQNDCTKPVLLTDSCSNYISTLVKTMIDTSIDKITLAHNARLTSLRQDRNYLYLQNKNLIFNYSPTRDDYIRIETDYSKSLRFTNSFLTRIEELNSYVSKYGFILTNDNLEANRFSLQPDIDIGLPIHSRLLDALKALKPRTPSLLGERNTPSFKVTHSQKCLDQNDGIKPVHTFLPEHHTLQLCYLTNHNVIPQFSQHKEITTGNTTTFIPYRRINDVPLLTEIQPRLPLFNKNFPSITFSHYKQSASDVILGDNCSIKIENLDSNPIIDYKPNNNEQSISEPWYGLHKAILLVMTTLAYTASQHTAKELSKFHARLTTHLTIFEQSQDFPDSDPPNTI
jgi:hypothetical protein